MFLDSLTLLISLIGNLKSSVKFLRIDWTLRAISSFFIFNLPWMDLEVIFSAASSRVAKRNWNTMLRRAVKNPRLPRRGLPLVNMLMVAGEISTRMPKRRASSLRSISSRLEVKSVSKRHVKISYKAYDWDNRRSNCNLERSAFSIMPAKQKNCLDR